MKQFSVSAALACAAFSTQILALDFHVVPSSGAVSSDVASSSQNTFHDLASAQKAVRKATAGMREDITVHIADGLYQLKSPLNFTSVDSGQNGHTVTWKATGSNAVLSGGIQVTNWKLVNASTNLYAAKVPKGLKSRNLYVDGWAANYARRMIKRTDFKYTNTSMVWTSSEYDWLMTIPGIAGAEVRFINSFTDRYAPIEAVGNRELIMTQLSWTNNIIGYDTIPAPNADFGVWVQNALPLLAEGGQYYLDSDAGMIYYMPLAGQNMAKVDAHLGLLEALVAVGGTYGQPAHDLVFEGLNFVSQHSLNSVHAWAANRCSNIPRGSNQVKATATLTSKLEVILVTISLIPNLRPHGHSGRKCLVPSRSALRSASPLLVGVTHSLARAGLVLATIITHTSPILGWEHTTSLWQMVISPRSWATPSRPEESKQMLITQATLV
jgi:hypothetical protein